MRRHRAVWSPGPTVRCPGALARVVALLVLPCLAPPAPAAAAATGDPPWRSGDRLIARLFDAREDLLLGTRADAARDVRRAERALAGPLRRGLRARAPEALRRLLGALADARHSARAGDDVGLASSSGRARAALYLGSYRVTLAAVEAADRERAREWLLLRDFRTPTRFTRSPVGATDAISELRRPDANRGRVRLAVVKDLLDAYQSKLREFLDDAARAGERGFGAKRAERTALAAGYWLILRGRYRSERGPPAAQLADLSFRELERIGADDAALGLSGSVAATLEALDGFTAAPFSPEEQARRAQQLISFLDLVPIEYDDGTEDGRVTVAFEIQEAVAFRSGAEAAFDDLESTLAERDPKRTAEIERALEELRIYVEDAARGREVVDDERVDEVHERASDAIEASFPEDWQETSSDSDFDLVALSLDRMEVAAGAGEFKQAEQARLEAYGFFEFGPEQSLRSLAPDIVADVEGLVWYGAKGEQGLAQLLAKQAPRDEIRDSRLALNESLAEARGALGEGASGFGVVTNAAVIVFREGLEAVLILAAVTAGLAGAARERRSIVFGVLLALIATGATWVLAQTLLTSLQRHGEKLEAIVGLVALGVLLLVLNWFYHRVYWTEHIKSLRGRKKRAMALSAGGLLSAQAIGLVLLGFSTVYREGFETVLFLQALELNAGGFVVAQGVALGMVGVVAVAAPTFVLQRRLPYKRMLVWTGVLIGAVLLVMVGKTVRTMQGVGWMPITPIDVELPFWAGVWLGVFPTVETAVAQALAGLFVIGSYSLAEWMRKSRARRAHRRPARAAGGEADGSASHDHALTGVSGSDSGPTRRSLSGKAR